MTKKEPQIIEGKERYYKEGKVDVKIYKAGTNKIIGKVLKADAGFVICLKGEDAEIEGFGDVRDKMQILTRWTKIGETLTNKYTKNLI